MKKILFPATSRVHLARQQLLLEELKKYFEVDVFIPKTKNEGGMSVYSILLAIEFSNFLVDKKYDAVLIRGDRFELLGVAMVSSYRSIPIIHIEGGDLSGVIDNRIRFAITHLSEYHFCTNQESHARLIHAGIPIGKVWNFGSLDVEFAGKVKPKKIKDKPYIFVAYHPIRGENSKELDEALKFFSEYEIIGIRSNKDYGQTYGTESYGPEDYINLMRGAKVCVGNSSSFLKEASILKVGVVNIGSRQEKRLKPFNVLDVPCLKERIQRAIEYQIKNKYEKDLTYYQPNTSKKIAKKLKEII